MSNDDNIIYQELHNINNKFLTHEDLKSIFDKSNILDKFSELKLNIFNFDLKKFQKAFTHISYTDQRHKKQGKNVVEREDPNINLNLCVPIQDESMERLEWLGDSILQSVVAIYIWERFPNQDEGFYTKTRSKLVKTEALGKFGEYLGFNKLIIINKHMEDYCNGRNNPKHLEDCFEAFIGALFEETCLEFKYEIVTEFIINIIERVIDIPILIMYDSNYKDKLMRYYQKHFDGNFPTYSEIRVEEISQGNDEKVKKKIFTMGVNDIYGDTIATGTAKSKKEAEQIAAKEACKIYKMNIIEGLTYYFI